MRKTTVYRVMVNNIKGGWDVFTDEFAANPEGRYFMTQEEAVNYARKASQIDEADLQVYDTRGQLAWQVTRSPSGSTEQGVFDEGGSTQRQVRVGVSSDLDIPLPDNQIGIPQGQIQPKK